MIVDPAAGEKVYRELKSCLAAEKAAAKADGARLPGTEAHRAWQYARDETDVALAPVRLELSPEGRYRSSQARAARDALRTYAHHWREQDYPRSATRFDFPV